MNRDISLGNWLCFISTHRIAYFPHVKLNMLLFILIFPFSWEPSREGLCPGLCQPGSHMAVLWTLHLAHIQLTFLLVYEPWIFFSELSVVGTNFSISSIICGSRPSWLGFFCTELGHFPHASSQMTIGRAVWRGALKICSNYDVCHGHNKEKVAIRAIVLRYEGGWKISAHLVSNLQQCGW